MSSASQSSSTTFTSYTSHLPTHPLFQTLGPHAYSKLDGSQQARLSYARAKAIGTSYNLTPRDIQTLTPKFWSLNQDPALLLDRAATTLLTIQYNLVIGTLTQYMNRRLDLLPLIDDLLRFKKLGQYCLTELAHGLDAENLETTATLLPNGEFCLNTPTPGAAKFMPPTAPAGTPCVGIIMARLIVNDNFHGVRPFVVNLNDGERMCEGITCRKLPYRGGTNPVNHSITSFNNVRLPATALLGPLERTHSLRSDFAYAISRVAVGTMALSLFGGTAMDLYAAIGYMYSSRRMIHSSNNPGQLTPIISFRTQQIPIVTCVAQAYVLKAFFRWACKKFSDPGVDMRVRHGIAACAKTISIQHSQASVMAISERCGAQGLFGYNQMSTMHAEVRGIAIAEGDILGLSIRLANELLLGRYSLPSSTDPDSLLARHEQSLLSSCRSILHNSPHHRSPDANRLILPKCQPIVEAIGHRMAYDAAVSEGVLPCLIDLYEASVMKYDAAWYAEEGGVSRGMQEEMESKAVDGVLPHLGRLVEGTGVGRYVSAPVVGDREWNDFVDDLECFEGDHLGSLVVDSEISHQLELKEIRARL